MIARRYFTLSESDEPLVSEPVGKAAVAVIVAGLLVWVAWVGMA